MRGAYGTAPSAHAAGAQFARLDNSIFSFSYTQDFIGTTIYIKLVSFNIYGGGQQLLSDVAPYAHTLTGLAFSSPLPDVTNLTSSYVASITQLAWTEVTDFRSVLYEVRKGSAWTGAQVLGRVAHSPFAASGDGTYWVGVYSQPLPGLQVYSPDPPDLIIAGAQITSNVIASYDEAATGWMGTITGDAIAGGGVVRTGGSGNILLIADYLNTPDILDYGGIGNGIYQIPAAHVINIGRVAPCSIMITWLSIGQHITDNILVVLDYPGFPDLLDYAASANTDVYPEIALSQDGSTWGAWQKYAPGSYNAMAFTARMQLMTLDPTVEAILQEFVFSVDVPDRDDHYVGLGVPSGGLNLVFTPDGASSPVPFNGGPQGSPAAPERAGDDPRRAVGRHRLDHECDADGVYNQNPERRCRRRALGQRARAGVLACCVVPAKAGTPVFHKRMRSRPSPGRRFYFFHPTKGPNPCRKTPSCCPRPARFPGCR